MKHSVPGHPSVVVYVNGSCPDHGTGPGGFAHGELSVVPDARPAARFDPHKVHREFPDRWRDFIRATYRSLNQIMRDFDVSEKTARNWWTGATGVNGGHVAIARRLHRASADRMLFEDAA